MEKVEYDTRVLVEMLIKDEADLSDNNMVFTIVVGGTSKTTVSKKVFIDEAVQGKLTKNIWLGITPEYIEV